MNKKTVLACAIIGMLTNGLPVLARGESSYSAGEEAKSPGDRSVAIGASSNAEELGSVALGSYSNAKGAISVALGYDSSAVRVYDEVFSQKLNKLSDDKNIPESYREVSLGKSTDDSNDPLKVLSQITYVAPGTEDTDAVNFYQLKKVKQDLDERIGEVDKIKTTKNNVEQFENEARRASQLTAQYRDNANTALTEIQTHRNNVYDAFTKVKGHENSADSIVKRLKRAALLTEAEVTQDSDGTMHIGEALTGSQIFVSGKQGDRVISGVASGARNSDAVNVSQLNTVRTTANYASQLAQKNSSRINHLEDRLSKTNTKIERGLATSAALTGLFQPYGVGKVNFTASVGGYGASQALAVGTGYRITENAAIKAGVAYSKGNHVMYNASFNFEW